MNEFLFDTDDLFMSSSGASPLSVGQRLWSPKMKGDGRLLGSWSSFHEKGDGRNLK